MSFKRIDALLKVEYVETAIGSKGLRVYLKMTHDSEFIDFFLTEYEINTMHEVLHQRD